MLVYIHTDIVCKQQLDCAAINKHLKTTQLCGKTTSRLLFSRPLLVFI